MLTVGALSIVRAYALSIAVFAILHRTLTAIATRYVNAAIGGSNDLGGVSVLINGLAYFIYLIAGFVTAQLAKQHRIVHGGVTGALSAITAFVAFGVAPGGLEGMAIMFANGALFGAAGGIISTVISRWRANAS